MFAEARRRLAQVRRARRAAKRVEVATKTVKIGSLVHGVGGLTSAAPRRLLRGGLQARPVAVLGHALKAKKRWRKGRRGRRGLAGLFNRIHHTVVRPALNVASHGIIK